MFESSEGLLHWNTKISLQCRRRVPTKQWRTMDRSGRVQWGWVRLLRCHRALWWWFWFDHDIGTNISSLQCIGIVVSWYQEALVLWVVDMKWYCGQLDRPCLNCPLYSQWLADRERVKGVDQHQTSPRRMPFLTSFRYANILLHKEKHYLKSPFPPRPPSSSSSSS